jgi:hypothetical protein
MNTDGSIISKLVNDSHSDQYKDGANETVEDFEYSSTRGSSEELVPVQLQQQRG